MRFDLAPLLLAAAFLLLSSPSIDRKGGNGSPLSSSVPGLLCRVVVGSVAGLMAHEVVEAFSLNPAYLLHSAFAKPAGSAEFGQGPVGAGGWDFMSHDPVLVLGAIIAVLIGL